MDRAELHLQVFGAVQAFDDDEGIFLIYPNKLGFGELTSPLSGGGEELAEKLNMINQLSWPTDTLLQYTLYASPDLVEITGAYRDLRRGVQDPLLRAISTEHQEFLRQGAYEPVDPGTGMRLRDTRLVITVQVPFKGEEPTSGERRLVHELRIGFQQALSSAGLKGLDLNPVRYLRFMETVLNQSPRAAWKQSPLTAYDDQELLCSQILDASSSIEADSQGLWLGGDTRVRVLTPKRYPESLEFGMAIRYLMEPRHGSRGIRENALVTVNIIFPEREGSRSKLEKDHMWATQQSSTPMAKYISYFRKRKASIEAITRRLEKGDRIVKAYISLALITQGTGSDKASRELTEERSIAASINAQSYWREFHYQLMEDQNIQLAVFSQMLPFAAEAEARESLQRYRTLSGMHATAMIPVIGSWRGTGTPLLTLFARDGQVQPLSMWDTDSNMNFLVAAESGAGKSVFAQAMTEALRSTGARVWIIDVGDSYRNLCESLNGQYITYDGASPPCINPFTVIQDFDEEVDMLLGIIAIMTAPTEGLSDLQTSEMKRILRIVWQQHQHDAKVDHLAAELKKSERQEIRDLGTQLHSFTSEGEYGRYFNSDSSIDLTNNMIVLELGALKAKPHLQRVVLLTLMYQISQAVYAGDRSVRQMLLVDEAWQLLASDETAEFIERAYRQFRKHGASVGIVTQSVNDVWQTNGGRAIAENSAALYLLRQKPDAIDAVQKEGRLPLDNWGYTALKSVHTITGQYSEIMCITPRGTGIGRLILNNFQKVMYSTKPEDVVALKTRRDRGMSLAEAIKDVVTERFGRSGNLKPAIESANQAMQRGR